MPSAFLGGSCGLTKSRELQDEAVDQYWAEIADHIEAIEELYEVGLASCFICLGRLSLRLWRRELDPVFSVRAALTWRYGAG